MKTVFRSHYGPPDGLQVVDVETPSPREGQILVRVHAATVNRTDCGGLRGRPFVFRFFAGFPRPRHQATGTDFAGEITAVGPGVQNFRIGDRVWGFDDHGAGSHAQYVLFPAKGSVARMPEGVTFEDAVASLEGAHYALNFINKVSLRPGQRVLVNGGTGAIGSAAIQILKARGLHVTAVCGSRDRDRVSALGPDRVIGRESGDFIREEIRYDFVFDAVGKSTFGACRKILVPGGVYISSELGPGGQNLLFALVGLFSKGTRVIFPIPFDIKSTLRTMAGMLEARQFKPLIDRRYPIEQIREAFEYVESGEKIGNVILTPQGNS